MSGRVLMVCAAIGATTLPACDKLFDIRSVPDPDSGRGDATDGSPADVGPPGDAIAPCFDQPVQVPGVANGTDPQMSSDRREVVYTKGSPGAYDLYHSTRINTESIFLESPLDTLNTNSEETDPALTADGLLIVFKSNRNSSNQQVWQATRANTQDPFGNVILAKGLEALVASGIDISPDGLTIYVDDGSRMYVAHRTTWASSFNTPTAVSNGHVDYPSVTPNGLEVFSNGMGIERATRQTNADTEKFQGSDPIDTNHVDGDVLPDNSALIMVGGDTLYTRERCN